MAKPLTAEEIDLLSMPLRHRQTEKTAQALQDITTNMERYAENSTQSRDKMIELLVFLIKEDRTTDSLQLYCRYLIAKYKTKQPDMLPRDLSVPIEMYCLEVTFILTFVKELASAAMDTIAWLAENRASVHELLHAVIISSIEIDACSLLDSDQSHMDRADCMRYIIFGSFQNVSFPKVLSYCKLSLILLLEDPPTGASRLPHMYREALASMVLSPQGSQSHPKDPIVEVITSAVCEALLYSSEIKSEGRWLEWWQRFDQVTPLFLACEVVSKYVICMNGKAIIRKTALNYLISKLADMCEEYEVIEYFHDETTLLSHLNNSTLRVVVNGTIISKLVSRGEHARILQKSYILVWKTVLDVIMLDPAEAVRLTAITAATAAIESISQMKLSQEQGSLITSQYLEVMLMKCSDVSEKVSARSLSLLLQISTFEVFAGAMQPAVFFQALRNLLRTSRPSFKDEKYQAMIQRIVTLGLVKFSMEEVTRRNFVTTYEEDLQEAVELTISRLKLSQLEKCSSIDINRMQFVIDSLRKAYTSCVEK